MTIDRNISSIRRAFKGVKNLNSFEGCSVTKAPCRYCTEECPARVDYVRRFSRIIGWMSNGRVIKTNPQPSKRYRMRVLGLRRDKDGRQRFDR